MKAADVRAMTLDQLDDEVLKLKKEQFNLRFQRATGQLENTSRVRAVRRDIARIKTIAAQKRAAPSRSSRPTRRSRPSRRTRRRSRRRRKAATQSPPRANKRALAHKPNKSKK